MSETSNASLNMRGILILFVLALLLMFVCSCGATNRKQLVKIIFHFPSHREVACAWVSPNNGGGDYIMRVDEVEFDYPASMEKLECSFAKPGSSIPDDGEL